MTVKLTQDEQRLVDHAKQAVVKYNKLRQAKGEDDTLYAFVLSDSGKIFEGACFETDLEHANICGERHAIANMILEETYKAKIISVVITDPVPEMQEDSTTPCGTCRSIIWEFKAPKTTILSLQYMRNKENYVFPKVEKHTIKELYPDAYEPVEWEKK